MLVGGLALALVAATFAATSAPNTATAQSAIRRTSSLLNEPADPIAVKLITLFAQLDAVRGPGAPGRVLGSLRPSTVTRGVPSWLGHFAAQVRYGFRTGQPSPLSHIEPVVMDAAGGPARARPWRALHCGWKLAKPMALTSVLKAANSDELLQLEFVCRSGRRATMIVVTDVQGRAKEAFGIAIPSTIGATFSQSAAVLRKGHRPLVRLAGNFFVAQVQWSKPPPEQRGLPRFERFGDTSKQLNGGIKAPLRGLWLFSPTGRPVHALFGPSAKPALRIGLLDHEPSEDSDTRIEQFMADGSTRAWLIDKNGRMRHKP